MSYKDIGSLITIMHNKNSWLNKYTTNYYFALNKSKPKIGDVAITENNISFSDVYLSSNEASFKIGFGL